MRQETCDDTYVISLVWGGHKLKLDSLAGANDTRPNAPISIVSERPSDSVGVGSYSSSISNADNSKREDDIILGRKLT